MSNIISDAIIKWKRGLAADWTSENPILADSEAGKERDTGFWKLGDGATAWNSLDYQPSPAEVDGKASLSTYSTGWVANSDWTNAELTATHSLSTDLSDLIVKFFISTDGTEANAFEVIASTSTSSNRGITIYQVSTNAVKIQTGADGIIYINDSGSSTLIDTESWYYKISVYKLS